MLVPNVELTLTAPPRRGEEPYRGFVEPGSPDRIAVTWQAVDPGRRPLAVAGVVAGAGLVAAAAIASFLHPALLVLGVIAGVAAAMGGYRAQLVAGRVDADDAWLVVRGSEERRIHLPEITRFDVLAADRSVHAVAALRAGPPVVIGTFSSADDARSVLAPLRAHCRRAEDAGVDDAAVPARPLPAVRAPRGLRARRTRNALTIGRSRYALSPWLLWPGGFAVLAIMQIVDGTLVGAGIYALIALSALYQPPTGVLTAALTEGSVTLRAQGTTLHLPLARLACLEVGADGAIRAILRGGGHVAVPAPASPRDALYVAQELGATLGVPVVAPALPAGAAVPALPAGAPSSAA